jgi:response regulator RpfG family c-di-GMP phosphodiesterase
MRIKSRTFLLALLVASQAACLGFGVMWATGWLWRNFESVVYNYVIAEGKAVAQEVALKASEMRLHDVEPGSADWGKLQQLCEQELIPHSGFVCIMRRDTGAMLCHPNLQQDPGLLRLFPGRGLLINGDKSAPITEVMSQTEAASEQVATGKVELDGDIHVFTGFSMPKINAILAVYQSDMAIDLFIASTIRPVMQVGYVLSAFIVGATAIITLFLINRYEAGLAEANSHLERQVQERTRSLVRTRDAVIFGLAKLSESRDKESVEHLERIRSYVTILATELAKTNPEIDRRYVSDLAVASLLHDIGKVGIPDSVLLKPGPLSPTERHAMELHTVLGSECLAAIQKKLGDDDFLEIAQQVASGHHENWDGSGYPHGLQGKQISLAARIVALADVYDALTSARPYKEPVGHAEARQWIVTRYAQQFDPAVVEAFIARESDFERISVKGAPVKLEASDGHAGSDVDVSEVLTTN